jgi:membrane associated rhomboid family serine protease
VTEKQKLFNSIKIPLILTFTISAVKGIEYFFNLNFAHFGIYPRDVRTLSGILFYPFIHNDFAHLANNMMSLFSLTWVISYFYGSIFNSIILSNYLISGLWLWCLGRPSGHIGASGMIYALAAFLILSGIIRKNKSLSYITMLIIFGYGSLVWGLFPIDYKMSFEGHITGALAGIVTALYFKNDGPENDHEIIADEDNIPKDIFGEKYWEKNAENSNETSEK